MFVLHLTTNRLPRIINGMKAFNCDVGLINLIGKEVATVATFQTFSNSFDLVGGKNSKFVPQSLTITHLPNFKHVGFLEVARICYSVYIIKIIFLEFQL